MASIKKLPESELEIMLIIWEANEPITSDYLMKHMDKTWTQTTLLNFLARLCRRGFLTCHKEDRHNVYQPLVEKNEYLQKESRYFMKKLYHNSLTDFVASLYDGKSISKSDLEELKKYIEEAK